MVRALFSLPGTLLALQLAAVVASLAAIALYPPRSGRMILIPVWPGAERGLAARALESGALLVDRGPVPNSLVISGTRAAIAPALLSSGVLTLAAPAAGCGTPAA
ncbi:MAG: hypothetical protein V4574_21580 [Pseudomonadota bacterium]